jgi:hypothetical protein
MEALRSFEIEALSGSFEMEALIQRLTEALRWKP